MWYEYRAVPERATVAEFDDARGQQRRITLTDSCIVAECSYPPNGRAVLCAAHQKQWQRHRVLMPVKGDDNWLPKDARPLASLGRTLRY